MLTSVIELPAPVPDRDSAVAVADHARPYPLHHAQCQGKSVKLSSGVLDRIVTISLALEHEVHPSLVESCS